MYSASLDMTNADDNQCPCPENQLAMPGAVPMPEGLAGNARRTSFQCREQCQCRKGQLAMRGVLPMPGGIECQSQEKCTCREDQLALPGAVPMPEGPAGNARRTSFQCQEQCQCRKGQLAMRGVLPMPGGIECQSQEQCPCREDQLAMPRVVPMPEGPAGNAGGAANASRGLNANAKGDLMPMPEEMPNAWQYINPNPRGQGP
jgi:hypothetical protein